VTLDEVLKEARRLDEAATKGPWTVADDPGGICVNCEDDLPLDAAVIYAAGGGGIANVQVDDRDEANAALIAFARNNLPRLLAVAAAAVEARIVIKSIIDAHNARLTDGGKLIYSPPTMGTGFIGAIEWLAAFDRAARGDE